MISRYTFTDITVFSRANNNEYTNISDYTIADFNNEKHIFKSQSQYIIMLHAFAYERCLHNDDVYICDVTEEELMTLAGITNKRFIEGFGQNKDILALLCARKIISYNYGQIQKRDEYVYDFCRIMNINVNAEGYKYIKRQVPVLTKTFYKAC